MKNNIDKLKEKIRLLYPNQSLTDEELDLMINYLVQFFTIGAKITYQYKKDNKNTENC